MSGTSMDAIDAALVKIDNNDLAVVQYRQYPIPATVKARVRSINSLSPVSIITELDVVLGQLFADAVINLLTLAGLKADAISAIGSHGQTVLHLPNGKYPRTLQIGDPARIAVNTGITTVADFRRNDIAAGGQGAPLACAFHVWRFRHTNINRAVLNLGGMANITLLPSDPSKNITGFDTGPGNALMDNWTQRHLNQDYDNEGKWAASGRSDELLLKSLLAEPYFQLEPPKSTGKDEFNLDWLLARIAKSGRQHAAVDVQATLLELTARSVSAAVTRYATSTQELLVCGGGVHNKTLMNRLAELLPDQTIVSTDKYGIDADAVEAITFAWLAKCRLENRPANIPSVTGATGPVLLGAIYQR